MEKTLHFIGADLAKKSIDLVIHNLKSHLKIENNSTGFNQAIVWFKANQIPLTQQWCMNIPVFIAIALKTSIRKKHPILKLAHWTLSFYRCYARKIDRIDASRIARYGSEMRCD